MLRPGGKQSPTHDGPWSEVNVPLIQRGLDDQALYLSRSPGVLMWYTPGVLLTMRTRINRQTNPPSNPLPHCNSINEREFRPPAGPQRSAAQTRCPAMSWCPRRAP